MISRYVERPQVLLQLGRESTGMCHAPAQRATWGADPPSAPPSSVSSAGRWSPEMVLGPAVGCTRGQRAAGLQVSLNSLAGQVITAGGDEGRARSLLGAGSGPTPSLLCNAPLRKGPCYIPGSVAGGFAVHQGKSTVWSSAVLQRWGHGNTQGPGRVRFKGSKLEGSELGKEM